MAGSERTARPVKGRMTFDAQSMEDLGFLEVKRLLEALCKTESAQRRARDLAPTAHRPTVIEALESTDELRRIRVEMDGVEAGSGDRPASGERTNTPG